MFCLKSFRSVVLKLSHAKKPGCFIAVNKNYPTASNRGDESLYKKNREERETM